jgi:hypothetical protein
MVNIVLTVGFRPILFFVVKASTGIFSNEEASPSFLHYKWYFAFAAQIAHKVLQSYLSLEPFLAKPFLPIKFISKYHTVDLPLFYKHT